MTKQYINILEKQNEELLLKVSQMDLMYDIMKSKVVIIRTDLYNKINPLALCGYLEEHDWKMIYEKQHERYLSRGYYTPRKDKKIKIYLKDSNQEGARASTISKKMRQAVEQFCIITRKGELQVIYDILSKQL